MSMRMFKENGEYTEEYVMQLERTVEQLKTDVIEIHEKLIAERLERLEVEETDG